MQYIAENWNDIMSILNMLGLLIVGRYKGKK